MLAPCLPTTVLIEPSEPGRFIVVTLSRAETLGSISPSVPVEVEQAVLVRGLRGQHGDIRRDGR